ncbi:MAG: insulinase family protein [Chlamydiales bacterium]|nr:insulinase family protein [Chlamydiales bacterium]
MKKVFCSSVFALLCVFFLAQANTTSDYRGFVIHKSVDIPESHCTLVELEHTKTGLQVVHIQNDDPENFFAICFRTHPTKSHGVPHILEHSTIQGSKKFPVSNVFTHMNKRSFATFMNALTGHDLTMYPAATQNEDDFYNLLDVYSDAVFHPLLKPETFAQEGWRLEFETFDDPTTDLVYKGVVYNEMKGHLTSHHVRLVREITARLLPDVRGDVFAGGDPKNIPELTYDEFVQFHKDNYHLGNSLYYFYGNLPLEKHLDFLVDTVIGNQSEKSNSLPPVRELQPRFTTSRHYEIPYPVTDSTQDKTVVGVSYLTTRHTDYQEVLAMQLLDYMLMGLDISPVKAKLLELGICKSVDTYIDTSKEEIPFIFIFDGCSDDQAKAAVGALTQALQDVVASGISSDLLERAIVRFELDESELKKGSGPVGLSYLRSTAVEKLNGGLAQNGLTLRSQLAALQKHVESHPNYFAELIQKHFLNNTHRVSVILTPSLDFTKEEQDQEKITLKNIKAALTPSQKDEIIAQSRRLRQEVETLDILPTITLESVARDVAPIEIVQENVASLEVFHHPAFTNHITYVTLEYALPQLTEEEAWHLGLYTYLLPKLGTNSRGYNDTLALVAKHTGGIGVNTVMHQRTDGMYPTLKISGYALDRKADILFDLMYDTITSADFSDTARIKQLLVKRAGDVDSTLTQMAMSFATEKSLSFQSPEGQIISRLDGVEHCLELLRLSSNLDQELPCLIEKLQNLQKKILPQAKMSLIVVCDDEAYKAHRDLKFGKLHTLPVTDSTPWNISGATQVPNVSTFSYHIASPVAFNARAFRTITFSPYLLLASELITNTHLFPRIRERGGAYFAGAGYDPTTGDFAFKTYRDPNITKTNEAFSEAIAQLVNGDFTEDDVQSAKIGLLQMIDKPVHPSQMAYIGYKHLCLDRSLEERNAFRHALLAANRADIMREASLHLQLPFANSVFVTFASKDMCEFEIK